MEEKAVSAGKAMVDGVLGYDKSKATGEIALQLGVQHDMDFITNELQMMQSFLVMAADGNFRNKVSMTWVKQIRDMAYIVEDSLMDFDLHKERKPFWGCIPRCLSDRHRIATEVKELRAKVEDMSNRNLCYRLVKEDRDSSASKPTMAEKQANMASAAMLGINEATFGSLEQEKSEVDLHSLITSNEQDLRVTAMRGTSGDHGKTSSIQEVYDDPKNTVENIMASGSVAMFPANESRLTDMEEKFKEKTGMLPSAGIVQILCESLTKFPVRGNFSGGSSYSVHKCR